MVEKPTNKINILGDLLFPIHFQFFGILLLIGGFVVTTQNNYLGILLILLAIMIFTGRDGVVFYPREKIYMVYRSFLLLRFGKKKPYGTIDKIFINSERYSKKTYTMHTSQYIEQRITEYNVFVKLDGAIKLYLGHHKDKKKLLIRFTKIAEILQAPLQDNTN